MCSDEKELIDLLMRYPLRLHFCYYLGIRINVMFGGLMRLVFLWVYLIQMFQKNIMKL
jgi:hypothetical protein